MTVDEKLARINVKVERAKEHIVNLKAVIKAFYDSSPYKITANHDPKTGQPVSINVVEVAPIPNIIVTITGDAIQNLRSALDHLAHQLALMVPGADPDGWDHNFPFWNEPKVFKAAVGGKIKSFRQDAIDALRDAEPCKGMKGHELWLLNRLNNIDKHRLLLAVGTTSYGDMNLGGLIRTHTPPEFLAALFPVGFPEGFASNFYVAAAKPNVKVLKAGDVLPVSPENAQSGNNLKLRLTIALNESGIVEGEPLIETIEKFAKLVSGTIDAFKPCLS